MSLMSWNTEYMKARSESKEYGEEGHANIVKKIKFCLEGINNIEGFTQTELREMYDLILQWPKPNICVFSGHRTF